MKIVNPATEEQIGEIKEDSQESLTRKLDLLRSAQPAWQKVPVLERARVMTRFAELLKEHIGQLADVLTSEMGKPLQQSRNEVNGAITRMKWLTDHAHQYLSDEIMN